MGDQELDQKKAVFGIEYQLNDMDTQVRYEIGRGSVEAAGGQNHPLNGDENYREIQGCHTQRKVTSHSENMMQQFRDYQASRNLERLRLRARVFNIQLPEGFQL